MSPKNSEASKEFTKILKSLVSTKGFTTVTLHNIDCQSLETNVRSTTIYNSNKNNLLLKPIINNTSIKASNKTCNLIGKMINDVSKTTISGFGHCKQNDKALKTPTATTTVLPTYNNAISEGGTNKYDNDDDDDDFPSTAIRTTTIYTNNEQLNTITNESGEQQQNMTTNTNDVYKERLTSTDWLNPTSEFLTKQQQHLLYEESKINGEPFSVTVKPSLLFNFNNCMRHKNIAIEPYKDSYQRTVDLQTSHTQCELLEFKKRPPENHTDYLKQTLAERKALLKKEFFKDLTKSETSITKKELKLKCSHTALNKRVLKKQHNLKLKIPVAKDSSKFPKESDSNQDSNVSLVALRKLDLEKKIQPETCKKAAAALTFNSQFPRVKELAKKFNFPNKMIVPKTATTSKSEVKTLKTDAMEQRHSPLSDEGCNLGHSPYSSDDDNDSIRTTNTAIERLPGNKHKDKVARSASSDSALGLEVDEPMDVTEQQQMQPEKRRMTLTVTDLPLRPALLPLAEPTLLPDSPTVDIPLPLISTLQPIQVPTKVLLEERVVEIPDDSRSGDSSRRESSQSCFSDYPACEMQGVRFVRTPSVVVSDYSDDVTCGITLEEIEYFRAQRQRRRHSSLDTAGTEKDAIDNNSDISASSSCSNLYYCGSTISALDGAECLVNGVRLQLERKTSDCSNYSVSGDEDASAHFSIPEQPEDCQDITDMLANQHLCNKRSKKVGISADLLSVDNTNIL